MIKYTKHVKEQMSKRNITHGQILVALRDGQSMPSTANTYNVCTMDHSQRLIVITNKAKDIVVTTFWMNNK